MGFFSNTELAIPDSLEVKPEEKELIQGNKLDQTDLVWERPYKGKKHALDNKLESKQDVGPNWVEVYRDVCTSRNTESTQYACV